MNILLIENNSADARLIVEVFKDFKIRNNIHVVEDEVTAMDFLDKKE